MSKAMCSIEGLNLDHLLQKIHKNNIDLFDINKENDTNIIFCIKNSDLPKLVALLKDSCYNIKAVKKSGRTIVLKFLLNRIALFFGIVVFIVVSTFYGTAIRRITYLNDAENYSEVLAKVLKEQRVAVGSRNINTKELSAVILKTVPDFAYVNVYLDGVNLTVSAFTRDNNQSIDKSIDCNIVSEFDGVITRVIVLSGMAVVKIGDKVEKGQTLIKGIIGPEENSVKVLAIGEVYGITDIIYTEYFETVKNVPYRTGNYYTKTNLKLFGLTFPAKSEEAKNFVNFETEFFSDDLFANMILPFKRVREVCYEIDYQILMQDFEKVKSVIIAEAKAKAMELVGEDMAVENTSVTITDEIDKKIITIILNCEKKISIVKYN